MECFCLCTQEVKFEIGERAMICLCRKKDSTESVAEATERVAFKSRCVSAVRHVRRRCRCSCRE